jgi:hypothetical protein
MRVTKMESIEPGNPYLSDLYHMGYTIGTNVAVMFEKFPTDCHDYLIVVDKGTGERIRIELS